MPTKFPGILGTTVFKVSEFNVGKTGLNEEEPIKEGFTPISAIAPRTDISDYYPGAKMFILKLIADKSSKKILGAQVIGVGEGIKRLDVIATILSCSGTIDDVANLDLGYAPPYSTAIDAVIHAANILRNKIEGLAHSITAKELWQKIQSLDDFIILDVRTVAEIAYQPFIDKSRSRSHLVAQRILGPNFRGCLVTDFYAAYNLIPGRHQRCWVHLLRDLHALKEQQAADPAMLQWATAVRQLYLDACTWLAEHPAALASERLAEYTHLYTQACSLGAQYARAQEHPCNALAKRLLRHEDELFPFVLIPGLPADNNLAERSIRPLVIMRKISGGSRSAEGTKTRLTLATLLHTWSARHLNPFVECLLALQHPTATAPP